MPNKKRNPHRKQSFGSLIKNEWVHLLIPKTNMSQFHIRDDEIIITNVQQDNIHFIEQKPYYYQEENWNSMLELWCKVSGIRELPEILSN